MACDDYRPDHNGECLTCDEPAAAHAPPSAAALDAAFARLDIELQVLVVTGFLQRLVGTIDEEGGIASDDPLAGEARALLARLTG